MREFPVVDLPLQCLREWLYVRQPLQRQHSWLEQMQTIDKMLIFCCSQKYTWVGETAAAGADRTGIPLRGLLGVEWISTVCPGPSERINIHISCNLEYRHGRKTTFKPVISIFLKLCSGHCWTYYILTTIRGITF